MKGTSMKQKNNGDLEHVLFLISQGRDRTNLLKKQEQRTIAFLVQRMPSWVSSNMLTAVGFSGNVIITLGFILGSTLNPKFLLLGVLGFAISWFGDSLDGRIAYYRNKPRKWYGFSLDLVVDWIGIVMVGLGFIIYAQGLSKIFGYAFVVLYGLEIIITLLRYKINGQYSIDAGKLSPTEARIIISIFLVLEVLFHGTIIYMAGAADVILAISNFIEFKKLARIADQRDEEENKKSESKIASISAN